jgi:hypothetical protein
MTTLPISHVPRSRREDFLIHEAAHVVAAWELGRTVTLVTFDHETWSGRTHIEFATSALAEDDTSDRARELAEDDVIILHAGMAAQRTYNYEGAVRCTPRTDLDSVALILTPFETDPALLLAWSTYLAERALVFVRRPDTWRRIEELANALSRRCRLSRRQLNALRRRLLPPAIAGISAP